MFVKVCGITNAEQAKTISKFSDYIGYIFYDKSKRYTDRSFPSQAAKKVGVFVNKPINEVIRIAQMEKLDAIQLHGNESPEYCAALEGQVTIFKYVGIEPEFQFENLKAYEPFIDYFLFDTKSPQYGGTGIKFDWSILKQYSLTTPFILSGGIKPDMLDEIESFRHSKLAGIDLNSGFELEPGIKDTLLLKSFIDALKN